MKEMLAVVAIGKP